MSLGTYQHYKGGTYSLLLDNVLDADTGERFVVYCQLKSGRLFSRKYTEFFSTVPLNGGIVPRFAKLV